MLGLELYDWFKADPSALLGMTDAIGLVWCFGTSVPKRTHVYIEYFMLRELDFAEISAKAVNVISAAY